MNPQPQPQAGTGASEFARIGFEAAGCGMVLLTADAVILHANAAYCELVGQPRDQVIGTFHPAFAQPSNSVRLRELASAEAGSALRFDVEACYRRPDGATVWTSEVVSLARPGEGGESLLVAVARDISGEKAIELENRKIKYLSDETSEAQFLINGAGDIVYVNNAAALLTGHLRQELLHRPITDVWQSITPKAFQELFADASRRRVPGLEGTFGRKDGTTRPVHVNVYVSDLAGETLLTALVGDRSEVQHAREALRESEARLRIAVDLAQLSIYGWEPTTGALSWDARLKAMWGLPPDAKVDFDVFWAGVHPDDKPRVEAALKRTLDPADGFYNSEFRVIGIRDGVERWVAACGQTFFKDGKPTGYIGAALDITARKRTEVALEQAVAERTRELRDVVTELEAFSYSVSHDLRAPLRAVRGFGEALEEETRDLLPEPAKDLLRRIVRAASRMDRLIQDALTYSRLTRAELPIESVDVAALINGILEGYPQFQSPGADIQVHLPLPRVRGNVSALTQCFSNLIANAIKFVAPGVVPKIDIRATAADGRVRIAIRDNGVGIDPAMHEKIFDLFYRLDPMREGTGVGLAVVRRAAQRMSGTISLESEPGKGSTFILDLQAAPID